MNFVSKCVYDVLTSSETKCQRLVTPTVLECAPKKIAGCEVHVTVLKSEMDQVRHQRPLSWTPMQNSTGRTPACGCSFSSCQRGICLRDIKNHTLLVPKTLNITVLDEAFEKVVAVLLKYIAACVK